MLRYEKLPKHTPPTLVAGVLIIGGCLGVSLVIDGLVALYGLTGLLVNYFYPSGGIAINTREAAYLGLMGVAAACTTAAVGFLAFYMNRLSKKALTLSRILWLPLIIVTGLVGWEHTSSVFSHHLNSVWVAASGATVLLAGIAPAWLLRTSAGRHLHSR